MHACEWKILCTEQHKNICSVLLLRLWPCVCVQGEWQSVLVSHYMPEKSFIFLLLAACMRLLTCVTISPFSCHFSAELIWNDIFIFRYVLRVCMRVVLPIASAKCPHTCRLCKESKQ